MDIGLIVTIAIFGLTSLAGIAISWGSLRKGQVDQAEWLAKLEKRLEVLEQARFDNGKEEATYREGEPRRIMDNRHLMLSDCQQAFNNIANSLGELKGKIEMLCSMRGEK